jgi:hypothetical protein
MGGQPVSQCWRAAGWFKFSADQIEPSGAVILLKLIVQRLEKAQTERHKSLKSPNVKLSL